ncbi:MAG: hypothetical protein PHV07_09195 [Oscillospiraceae bacterium]|nr:hypothetical protein [Oscillospiraceae bacterium]
MLLQDINHNVIKQLKEDLKENFYHPLDRNSTPDYLKTLLYRICGQSKFIESNKETDITKDDRLLIIVTRVVVLCKSCTKRAQCTKSKSCQRVVNKHVWEEASYSLSNKILRGVGKGKVTCLILN